MAEWGMSLAEAMAFPLATALALWPAKIVRRGGGDSMPDYTDLARQKAKRKMRAWIAANFEVVAPSDRAAQLPPNLCRQRQPPRNSARRWTR